jgi:aspartyl-tRNA(Asn)/glutamyl-tRNA(Gln) amidotransferase subunit C
MKITENEARQLAELANIGLSDGEFRAISVDLSKMVDYFDELSKLDTDGVEPTYQVAGLSNVWREDETKPHLDREELLKLAPMERDGCVEVPRVL